MINLDTLKKTNIHSRDENIQFYEDTHTYIILTDINNKYTSVTTWIHSFFSEFDSDNIIRKMMKSKSWKEGHKYWGKTSVEIKELWEMKRIESSQLGTQMHFRIECFMNNNHLPMHYKNMDLFNFVHSNDNETIVEWKYFIEFIHSHPNLKPYRTEWMIYHEDIKIAGSIDMIYQNEDNSFSIFDWKRSKIITKENVYQKYAINPLINYLPDTNYWHYALQLNIYKYILQDKYNMIIKDMILIRLHPDSNTFEKIVLPDLTDEIKLLFEERKKKIQLIETI